MLRIRMKKMENFDSYNEMNRHCKCFQLTKTLHLGVYLNLFKYITLNIFQNNSKFEYLNLKIQLKLV